MRAAGILTGKGINIESLTVAPDPSRAGFSQMIVRANIEPRLRVRTVNEMNRLVRHLESRWRYN
jgi:hypothetical protein